MKHPWQEISLSDYENHMKLDSVRQLQTMNAMMAAQLSLPGIETAMVLGVAGGNGLEHVDLQRLKKVYGVDINRDYLDACAARFPALSGVLECICADLADEYLPLPHADLVIANLLVEYIGYPCFQRVIRRVQPTLVSCAIQINTDDSFVSDSPYLHAFDRLEEVHHQMETVSLTTAMAVIGYHPAGQEIHPLPNGKQLIRLDYRRAEA